MAVTITLVTHTRHSVQNMFEVSLNMDAHAASMAHTGESAVAGVTTGRIGLGQSVTWRARHFGLWLSMTTRITAMDEPHSFEDRQIKGPFKHFDHVHTFAPEGGGCVMTDTLTLASPVGGALVDRLILGPYLRRLLRQRNAYLVGFLDGDK